MSAVIQNSGKSAPVLTTLTTKIVFLFIQLEFPLLHLAAFASRPFPVQPSEGGFMFTVPSWSQHLAPLPPTRESSASVSSHTPQPSNYLGGSLLGCLLSVFPVLESKMKHTVPDVTSQVPTEDLMASLGLLTVLPWTQCGSQSPFRVAVVTSHSDLCSIWYPPRLQGFSAHTCVASHASVRLLHSVALLFHRYLTISCVLWPL